MRYLLAIPTLAATLLIAANAHAAEIRGQYLEARTCDVYTGPCFANAEMTLAGKEAVMAWKVEEGGWNGVSLEGLSAVLVVKAGGTLGDTGVFQQDPGRVESVIVIDEQATDKQQEALVSFIRESASELTVDVKEIHRTAIEFENDYYNMHGKLHAGRLASLETRKLKKGDCICTNEEVFYEPLVDVHQAMPAYALRQSYTGKDLGGRWTLNNTRSAFLATFRK